MTLNSAQESKESWKRVASHLAQKTQRQDADETLLRRSSWDQRRKVEVGNLIDLSSNVQEKYGNTLSFNLMLRSGDSQPTLINYKNPVSTKLRDPDFGALIVDDRTKKIEVIREVRDTTPR